MELTFVRLKAVVLLMQPGTLGPVLLELVHVHLELADFSLARSKRQDRVHVSAAACL